MPLIDLSRFCDNGTVIFRMAKKIDYNETTGSIRVTAGKITDSDQQAVLYIVVVLLFYSCGIVIGIVMYLKRERDEMEEERAYEAYLNFKADPARLARHFCKQQYTLRLKEMEEAQRLRAAKEKSAQEQLEAQQLKESKFRLSKKRHSHGNFHFLSGSKTSSPNTSPTTSRPPRPQIVIDNFDDLVEKGEIVLDNAGRKDSKDSNVAVVEGLLPKSQTVVNMEETSPILQVQTDDLRASGLASSMPALTRTESQKSNVIVTEL